jgi:hypothetical protein
MLLPILCISLEDIKSIRVYGHLVQQGAFGCPRSDVLCIKKPDWRVADSPIAKISSLTHQYLDNYNQIVFVFTN